ncbi:2-amino-4-hydroxy-6-hydroxymethyldihydropteridine diphosphokinase [Desulfoluna butyratoxydans]|uniref:2-amino-4-hydroxy-6-hydroxymethyldihydropteridine pyrophosphokinase n=1 Tax=Desulfoluna butyratoxydans TaxID=231438 RepID=A0A4U8YSG9_9BACT|nr:2-amino-4-hydroxy-6-hydroxymethyldihydropteridine diphosphokinase [Desulfoluna butyratoxydans]VFQ47316.1 7 8-dihydro-6-hydroxymethylpterin-pyrophosphokinase hppk [Desulfoluna butyratoxydans]
MMHDVFLCLGSNMGDRKANFDRALHEIESRGIARLVAVSPLYKTSPVDYTDQAWFLNGAARVETSLSPRDLLAQLKAVEADLGRDASGIRFGPRPIDIDILLYDDLVYSDDELTIPHPRMDKRAFVLTPLCDIDSEIIHPDTNKKMQTLLSEIDDASQEVVPYTKE